jgi:hypothetical protein
VKHDVQTVWGSIREPGAENAPTYLAPYNTSEVGVNEGCGSVTNSEQILMGRAWGHGFDSAAGVEPDKLNMELEGDC